MDARINNCPVEFAYRCPKRWEGLEGTSAPDTRHCGICERDVHLCQSFEDVVDHAARGHCVAFQADDPAEEIRMGLIAEPRIVRRPRVETRDDD